MTWVIFFLLAVSFFLLILTPVSPVVPGLIFLALQLIITSTGYLAWRRRRRHNRSSFLLAFFTMVHFFMLLSMLGIFFLITVPHEKEDDSIAFLRGVGNIVAARTGIQFGALGSLPQAKPATQNQSSSPVLKLEFEEDETVQDRRAVGAAEESIETKGESP